MKRDELEKHVVETKTDIKWIKEKITPICKAVEKNTAWRNRMIGAISVLTFLTGAGALRLFGVI